MNHSVNAPPSASALYVYERSDDTLVVACVPLEGRVLPQAWGVLDVLGMSDADVAALSARVQDRLREEGCCAVIADDAARVRRGLTRRAPVPSRTPPDAGHVAAR